MGSMLTLMANSKMARSTGEHAISAQLDTFFSITKVGSGIKKFLKNICFLTDLAVAASTFLSRTSSFTADLGEKTKSTALGFGGVQIDQRLEINKRITFLHSWVPLKTGSVRAVSSFKRSAFTAS